MKTKLPFSHGDPQYYARACSCGQALKRASHMLCLPIQCVGCGPCTDPRLQEQISRGAHRGLYQHYETSQGARGSGCRYDVPPAAASNHTPTETRRHRYVSDAYRSHVHSRTYDSGEIRALTTQREVGVCGLRFGFRACMSSPWRILILILILILKLILKLMHEVALTMCWRSRADPSCTPLRTCSDAV